MPVPASTKNTVDVSPLTAKFTSALVPLIVIAAAELSMFPPLMLKLLPLTSPVTLELDPVITPPTVEAAVCVPVTLVELPVITPPTVLAAVTVPEALTLVLYTLPLKLVALTLLPTVSKFAVLSNVNPLVALATPLSLNITCVLAPGEVRLPEMLPIKLAAYTLPVALIKPVVFTLPA